MLRRWLIAAWTALVLVGGVAGDREARAGACLAARCTCDDDCTNGFVCGEYAPGDKRCCGPPVKGTPCNRPADGGAAGDGGGGNSDEDDGCSCGVMGSRGRPLAAPLTAVATAWLVGAFGRRRRRASR